MHVSFCSLLILPWREGICRQTIQYNQVQSTPRVWEADNIRKTFQTGSLIWSKAYANLLSRTWKVHLLNMTKKERGKLIWKLHTKGTELMAPTIVEDNQTATIAPPP